jgi:hypothetical protein
VPILQASRKVTVAPLRIRLRRRGEAGLVPFTIAASFMLKKPQFIP